ncbi:MAG TPA: TIGR03862 family flavoprotein [Candidatus Omnitrophota bacterium]|nr:TIGR03862 family flavoprotein [Candidatus Omnitrophota bacterium]
MSTSIRPAIVIGAGPAGLMAAEALASRGHEVEVFDAMPSPARKFLLAGKGGLNLTHSEPLPAFVARYGARADVMAPLLAEFGPDQLRAWARDLGIETFVGTSGRVFPTDFKAAPLLRAWMRRLKASGVRLHARHRWLGWTPDGALRFATPDGEIAVAAGVTILALGGASWPKLGSDGGWVPLLQERGVAVAPLRSANCGFDIGWSEHLRTRFAGAPLKSVTLSFAGETRKGEMVVTETGIEGGLVYALSAPIRDAIARDGAAVARLDLKPDWSEQRLRDALAKPRGSRSLSSHLERAAAIKGVAAALLREILPPADLADPARLAAAIKALPLRLTAPRPLAEAISTAGGVRFEDVDESLMLRALPGVYVTGEMLDWEAPTGGYLLTACFALGRKAGLAAALSP